MNILSVLREKYKNTMPEREEELKPRKQLNATVNKDLIHEVRRLASDFAVPRFCIVEHGLAIGCHYMTEAMQDHEKQDTLRQHLINWHLLGSGTNEGVAILTIGERGRAWQLLALTKRVIRNVEALKRSMHVAERTGDTYHMEKQKRELDRSVLRLADWIWKHGLGEIGEPIDNSGKEDKESGRNA